MRSRVFCSSETAPTPAPVGDHRHSTKRTTRGPRRRRASRDACIAQSSKPCHRAMVDGSNLNVHYDASLSLFLSVPSKKGGDATLATLLVGTRARGGLRSGGSARTNFCTKERPTTHCALGGSMERNWMSLVNERKKSLLSFKCQITFYPKRCITKRLLLKLFRRGRARPQGTTKNGRSIDAFFCRRGRWFRRRRRRRCHRWW